MSGTIAQIVSLVSYGNDFIFTGKKNDEYLNNSTFKHCENITFKVSSPKKDILSKRELLFKTPYEWFDYLKKSKCKKLGLYYKGTDKNNGKYDYSMAGFLDEARNWYIEAIHNNKLVFWKCKWEINSSHGKRWNVVYSIESIHNKSFDVQGNLNEAKESLKSALENINKFAIKQGKEYWSQRFKEAITELDSDMPTNKYYADIIVDKNYSLAAIRLLFSAQKAWVFGGMGWWNDICYEDEAIEKINAELSQNLYLNICKAIVVSVNSF